MCDFSLEKESELELLHGEPPYEERGCVGEIQAGSSTSGSFPIKKVWVLRSSGTSVETR